MLPFVGFFFRKQDIIVPCGCCCGARHRLRIEHVIPTVTVALAQFTAVRSFLFGVY